MKNYCRTALLNFGNSRTEHPDPAQFERHCHEKYELLYIVRGGGKCVVEGAEYPLSDGALFIFRPFEYHYVCPDPDEVYERCVFNFTGDVLLDAVRELPMLGASGNGIYFSGDEVNDNFCNVIESSKALFEENDASDPISEALCISVINQLLLIMGRESGDTEKRAGDELIGQIIAYLNRHLDEKITLDQTAKRFFISKYYLCRLFRNHTGVTVLSYLNSKRIAMAHHLISKGEPPTEVAYRVGFQDYSTFYRAYKKETGQAPTYVRE